MRTDISRLRSSCGREAVFSSSSSGKLPSPRRSGRGGSGGFTLVEAVVAILVIGIMVLTLYTAITTGFFSIRLARENLRATQVILEKMEVIRLLRWDQLNAGILPSTFTASYNPANPQEKTIYNGTISVTSLNPATRNYHPDMRRITVTIKWDSAGLPRQRQLSTYMARAGIQNYVINGTE